MARSWRNLAAPDDPNAWYDVDGVWPTIRGTYETAHLHSETAIAASSSPNLVYAFQAKTPTGRREYAVTAANTTFSLTAWEYSGGTLTSRTTGTASQKPMMAQFGNATILVGNSSNNVEVSTGGNFSAIADAPDAEIVVVQNNAVWLFNTSASSDGWAMSDIGDYTNWTTGESASGRLYQTGGPILAAVPYGEHVIALKDNGIYRLRYVGGVVKVVTELLYSGVGVDDSGNSNDSLASKYLAVAGSREILFCGRADNRSVLYRFDGSSPPEAVNPETDIAAGLNLARLCYQPATDTFAIHVNGASYLFYCRGMLGRRTDTAAGSESIPVMGDMSATDIVDIGSSLPYAYRRNSGTELARGAPTDSSSAATCYLQTSMVGRPDRKTLFNRLIPLLRRRTDLGTDSASLEFTLWRERHDTSATTTRTISEASNRKRFDLLGGAAADNFARFKVTFTALDVEVDDFAVLSKDAGED
jgi:hypothetical protein